VDNAAAEVYLDVQGDVTSATFRKAAQRIAWWGVGRLFAVAGIAAVLLAGWIWLQQGFTAAVGIVGGFALFYLLVLLRLFVAPRNTAFNSGHMRFVANADVYMVEGQFGTQTFRWATYKEAYVDRGFIYLLVTNTVAQLIPLQFVPDPEPLLNHLRKLGLLRPTPRTFILF
jgi:hypothetical protein